MLLDWLSIGRTAGDFIGYMMGFKVQRRSESSRRISGLLRVMQRDTMGVRVSIIAFHGLSYYEHFISHETLQH